MLVHNQPSEIHKNYHVCVLFYIFYISFLFIYLYIYILFYFLIYFQLLLIQASISSCNFLCLPISPSFQHVRLPCDLSSLINPNKDVDFQFVQLFSSCKGESDCFQVFCIFELKLETTICVLGVEEWGILFIVFFVVE